MQVFGTEEHLCELAKGVIVSEASACMRLPVQNPAARGLFSRIQFLSHSSHMA